MLIWNVNDFSAVKDYTHIMDLTRGHVAAIKHIHEGEKYKVWL